MGTLAVVWHYWIAPVLVVLILLAVVGTVAGYLATVTRARYPRD